MDPTMTPLGKPLRRIKVEPMPQQVPIEEPVPAEPVKEPEKVPVPA